MLAGRRIVLGVSGGIAAYKAVYLARRLVESGAELETIMTEGARRFLGVSSLAAVTGKRPYLSLFDERTVSPHTELARWADAVVIAPATTRTMAKLAHGLASDLLSATVLATRAPVVLAPAMHTEMWEHPATQRNVVTLQEDGYQLVGPASGALAGGDEGRGRMSEPEEILEALDRILGGGPMRDWHVLVTAGGTREPIDPVRYIGNRSSGKMGYELAAEAARRGARVVLVTSSDRPPPPGVEVVVVETADQMAEAVWSRVTEMDVVVMAAAVADFRPKGAQETKLRREAGVPELILEPTPDVLDGVAQRSPGTLLIGFAAETGTVEGALQKAQTKALDLLVANDVTAPGSGFGTDTNQVTLITPDGVTEAWPLLAKREVARRLWDRLEALRGSGAG